MQIKENKFFLGFLAVLAVLGGMIYLLNPDAPADMGTAVSITGSTMGTTYEVQIAGVALDAEKEKQLQARIETELLAVNQAMSTYLPDSEISRFNRAEQGSTLEIGARFREVVKRSFEIHAQTGGAFDPTLGPLIDLWGFGAEGLKTEAPSDAALQAALREVGMEGLALTEQGLRKNRDQVEINLSAIAKGYGVDRVAALLRREGIRNLYVEIGGELYCEGVNRRGLPWRIGIQVPEPGEEAVVMKVLVLERQGLATSGDYRNFVVDEAGSRHHILDPRTGRPAVHTLASVSVLAADCMTADAVATALFVMGTAEGLKWVEAHDGIEALFVDREPDGRHRITSTAGFDRVLVKTP